MGGKRRCIRNGKGKEKQLFRGIFAFIANRDLFAQSDFYFFHDSLRLPCRRQKIVQVEKNFWWFHAGARPPQKPATQPRRCRRMPTGTNYFLTALGKTRELLQRRKEKQLFRGIFAFIANRDLFAQSDFYFSTIRYACHAGARKLYRLRRTLVVSRRRAPAPEACDAAPSMSTHQPASIILTALGENAGIAPAAEG
eukprot:gene2397-1500_t